MADVSSLAVFVIVVFTASRVVPGPYCGSLGKSCCDVPVFYERLRVPVARQVPNQLPNTIYGACPRYGPDDSELTGARLGDRVDTQEKIVFAICVRNAKLQKLVETSDE